MTYLSMLEKFRIFGNLLLDYKIILVFLILLVALTFIYTVKFIDKKKYILSMIGSFVLVFGISIISNFKILSNTFDNFSTIFFGNIYFPSIYVYIAVLVILLVVFIVSMLNGTMKKIYKFINSLVFVLNNVIFVLILNIIAKNKIDIFSTSSLYTNTNLVVMLEISMSLFILWILSIVIIYTTNVICDKLTNKKTSEVVLESVSDTTLIENEVTLKEDIVEVVNDTLVVEDVKTTEEDNNVTFNDLLNGIIPTYSDTSFVYDNYNIIDPQKVYETKYKDVFEKEDLIINNIDMDDTPANNIIIEEKKPVIVDTIENIEDMIVIRKPEKKKEVIEVNNDVSSIDKSEIIKERLASNTVSLDELNTPINNVIIEKDKVIEVEEIQDDDSYSLDDYKKIVKMLTVIKSQSNSSNITIDDAVTLSLINDYSIDDCIKFKDILESNLN